ncbi:MAG: adenylate/guanylate cyclase domain-containing protein [Chloroflexi bacterium]|nr:MAG: adenylate/guanylate cyclase domain-containing protein [Chloroflexota bacterium]
MSCENNMSEKTSTTAIGELRQLKILVQETEMLLRNQRDLLKTRGFKLPPMALQALSSVKADIETLEKAFYENQVELSQLRFLADTTAQLNSSLNLDNILTQAMDVVISLTNAERGFIILRDDETGELMFRVIRDNEVGTETINQTPQISTTILQAVFRSGEPLLTDNAYQDDRLQSGQSILQMTLRSVLCVPLRYKNKTLGAVYVDNRLRAGIFTEREKRLLAAFANQVSVAIENAQLYEQIQRALVEIREMKDLMNNVFASIGSGVITTDAKHHIVLFNRAAELILGKSQQDVIGQRLTAVIPGVSANLDAYLANIRTKDADQTIEAELDVPQRGRIAVNMRFSPLKDANQNIQGVVMVMDDLTEQRGNEQLILMMKRYLPPEMVDNIHAISSLALGGESREVTCVYVDVRSVKSFPKDYRPQQIMEQINGYLARATNAIHRHKGIVDKYMGNIVMALFNTQLNPMQNHALQAVEAALDIRDAFIAFYQELGINPEPHFYRIGMNTGIATLGNVGSLNRREFTAIGDTINLSKRIEENTGLGQIIIHETTYQHILQHGGLPAHIRFVERPRIQVKGRQQLVGIYEVFRA